MWTLDAKLSQDRNLYFQTDAFYYTRIRLAFVWHHLSPQDSIVVVLQLLFILTFFALPNFDIWLLTTIQAQTNKKCQVMKSVPSLNVCSYQYIRLFQAKCFLNADLSLFCLFSNGMIALRLSK